MRPWELLQPFPFLSSFNRHHEQSYVIDVSPVNGFKFRPERTNVCRIFFLPSFLSFSFCFLFMSFAFFPQTANSLKQSFVVSFAFSVRQMFSKGLGYLHASSADSAQTGQLSRLVLGFDGRTCHLFCFVVLWANLIILSVTFCVSLKTVLQLFQNKIILLTSFYKESMLRLWERL